MPSYIRTNPHRVTEYVCTHCEKPFWSEWIGDVCFSPCCDADAYSNEDDIIIYAKESEKQTNQES